MINKPFFSVVIPLYNKELHISRAIESVLTQTYKNYELIIVCDPSTDNSTKIAESYSKDAIILYRNQPGPGGYAARNLGTHKAKGKWIAFLDADDMWSKTHLEDLYKLSKIYPKASILGAGWKTIEPDIKNQVFINKFHEQKELKKHYFFDFKNYLILDSKGKKPFYTSTVAIKKETLINAGLFPDGKAKRGGDIDTWLRVIYLANGLAISSHIGATYYRDSENMVTRTAYDDATVIRETIKKMLSKINDKETKKLLKKISNNYTINAWLGNEFFSDKKNFTLPGKLYYTVDPIKCLSLTLISILPKKIILLLRKIKNFLSYQRLKNR